MADNNSGILDQARSAESAYDAFTLAMDLAAAELSKCETAEARASLRGLHAHLFLLCSIQKQEIELTEVTAKLDKIEEELHGL